jgi:hypothetical protein
MFKSDILINIVACKRCFKQMIKPNQRYCRKCKDKVTNNKATNSKVYKMKYDKSARSFTKVENVTQKYIGKYFIALLN